MQLQDLQLNKHQRYSQRPISNRRRAITDRKNSSDGPSKLKVARASQFKDAPLSQFIYMSTDNVQSGVSSPKKEKIEMDQLYMLKRKTVGAETNNPFLKFRQKFLEKEKKRSMKNLESHLTHLDEVQNRIDGKITLREFRIEKDKQFVKMCNLGGN